MTTGPGQIVHVENRSSVSVTVYSVTLRNCDNIKASCSGPRSLTLHLRPHPCEVLDRVEPANAQKACTFGYTFAWYADSSTRAALEALAAGVETTTRQQRDARALADGSRQDRYAGERLVRIRALQWRVPRSPAITVVRPDTLVTVRPLQLHLADDLLPANEQLHVPLEVPIIVRP